MTGRFYQLILLQETFMNTTDRWETFAVIQEKSDRYPWWLEVFEGDKAPIKSILSHRVNVPGKSDVLAYELDIAALTPEMRERLVNSIAKRFGQNPAFVEFDLDNVGCPILADGVTACDLNPAKFL
jgi:hypothetical protein